VAAEADADRSGGEKTAGDDAGPVRRRARHVLAVSVLLGIVAVTHGGQAGAVGSWSAANLPAVEAGPVGAYESSPAVSCASPTVCVAVGSYAPVGVSSLSLGGGVMPMSAIWAGGVWTEQALPVPPGGSAVSLSAVSCPSPSTCVAVGQYSPAGGGVRPLAETLSNGGWAAAALPSPSRAYFTSLSPVALLGGVSCASITSCVAVGVYPVHRGTTLACCYRYFPLVERLAGSTWTASTAPSPRGGSNASLSGVSCSGSTTCVAVGNVAIAGGTSPMAETLTGARWRAALMAVPSDGSYPAPFPWTVSCAGSWCMALGAYVPDGGSGALVAETLSGHTWTPTALPLPAGGSYGFPFTYEAQGAVSCTGVATCVAVSTFQPGGGGQQGLAESFTGGSWSPEALAPPTGSSSTFPQAVSCSGSASCVAVGSYPPSGGGEGFLTETLSGSTWSPAGLPVPAASPDATLTALSCPSAGSCVAVGNVYGVDHVQNPMAETLASGSWTAQALSFPDHTIPSGDANPVLQGLSCPSASSCVAVGYVPGPALAEHPLAEMMSGGTWRPERLPLPPGVHNQSATLSGISCPTATSCVAVGGLQSEAAAVIETWAGGTWVPTDLSPPGKEPRMALSSVSCLSATSCVAVGAYWGSNPGFSRPLTATLSGSVWKVKKLRLPADARTDVAFTVPMLRSVSCLSTGSCTAVGFYPTTFDATVPLVETLSATVWRPVSPATVTGANWSLLWGVSCPLTGSCTAVGEADGVPLVETETDAIWTPTTVVPPTGDTGASLQAVSCASAASCTAAGGGIGVEGIYPVVAASN